MPELQIECSVNLGVGIQGEIYFGLFTTCTITTSCTLKTITVIQSSCVCEYTLIVRYMVCCRCMASSLVRSGFVRGSMTQGNGCYMHRCANNSLQIAVDNVWKTCPREGGPIEFPGFNGTHLPGHCNISFTFWKIFGRTLSRLRCPIHSLLST